MPDIKKLIKVSSEVNNNKYYEMHPQDDGTFLAKWGRVQGGKGEQQSYPINLFDKKYREKIRKGYKDITELMIIKNTKKFTDIKNSEVANLINILRDYSKNSISENYSVSSESVTQKQVDEAQKILNSISDDISKKLFKKKNTNKENLDIHLEIHKKLEDLYTIIPRKMKKVSDHMVSTDATAKEIKTKFQELIKNEQSTLDVMAGQVITNTQQNDDRNDKLNILEAMGLEITHLESGKEIDNIIRHLGDDKKKFRKAYKIINKNTQNKFDLNLNEAKDKTTKLFYHGSRNENWWSILNSGLVLRPTNAVISGKMFGYGLYFADKAKKSIGYTSLSGSYWAGGKSSSAFLSVFVVHTGKPYEVKRHSSELSDLTWEKLKKINKEYDSLFAQGGYDLINNEYIIYKENQCTIKYLVEISH